LDHPELVIAAYFLPVLVGEEIQIESPGNECEGIFDCNRTMLFELLHNKHIQIVSYYSIRAEGWPDRLLLGQ
jgi:hypothetical protein